MSTDWEDNKNEHKYEYEHEREHEHESENEHEKSYKEIIEDLKVSEKLEWESKKCFLAAQKKKSILNYVFVAIVIFGLLTSSLWVETYTLEQFKISNFLETFALLPLTAILIGLAIIIRVEQMQMKVILDDAHFRLNLALDIIRPLRDFLYSQARSSKLTAAQIATIKLRLARFPMDNKNHNRR